jgi:hypothetical protein
MKVEDLLHALVLLHNLLSRFNKCNLKVGYSDGSGEYVVQFVQKCALT